MVHGEWVPIIAGRVGSTACGDTKRLAMGGHCSPDRLVTAVANVVESSLLSSHQRWMTIAALHKAQHMIECGETPLCQLLNPKPNTHTHAPGEEGGPREPIPNLSKPNRPRYRTRDHQLALSFIFLQKDRSSILRVFTHHTYPPHKRETLEPPPLPPSPARGEEVPQTP